MGVVNKIKNRLSSSRGGSESGSTHEKSSVKSNTRPTARQQCSFEDPHLGHETPTDPANKSFAHRTKSVFDDLLNKKDDKATVVGPDGQKMSKHQAKQAEKVQAKAEKAEAREREEQDRLEKLKEEDRQAELNESPEMRARYGNIAAMEYGFPPELELLTLKELAARPQLGQDVQFTARIHTSRAQSAKLCFIIFREQEITLQGVLRASENVSDYMVKWAERLDKECIVYVKGRLRQAEQEVKSVTEHTIECDIHEIHVISRITDHPAFNVAEASIAQVKNEDGPANIMDRTRFNNRVLDLRTDVSQSIFRVQAAMSKYFRNFLDDRGFVEIHTPKLQGSATESGASVFKVEYFKRPAFLAQSPQLGKQLCMSGDMERVYEIGPVFRAEKSFTHRHLAEYTGLDMEMVIRKDYSEARNLIDEMLKFIFRSIQQNNSKELEVIRKRFPSADLVFPDETVVITFAEGVKLLNESGWREEDEELDPNEDLSTPAEVRLGELVKEKFNTDYYILDKFPLDIRPFYAMPDKKNEKVSNTFDIFVRGEEILTGGQRIHDADLLEEKMLESGIHPLQMEEYFNGFRWGAPPHAGSGIGLERLVMLFCKLGNIRHASLFPRDPKSLAEPKEDKAIPQRLRHPECDTLKFMPPRDDHEEIAHYPLTKLIANYGDATNTSVLDPKYECWRHRQTSAAIGFRASEGYAIIWGPVLCDKSQVALVAGAFLAWLINERKLKPMWACVSETEEMYLGGQLGWRTMACVAEDRLNPVEDHPEDDSTVRRKNRHAKSEGVKIHENKGELPEHVKEEVEKRMDEWLDNRDESTQIHITNLRPFDDEEHRRYFYATNKDGEITAIVVLAELSIEHGYQVKYALEFPKATNGTSEFAISTALETLADEGVTSVTFGAGAMSSFVPGDNIGKTTGKMLAKTYKTIYKSFKLGQKSEFRMKLGAKEDPVYVCFPKKGFSAFKAIHALMTMLRDKDEGATKRAERKSIVTRDMGVDKPKVTNGPTH